MAGFAPSEPIPHQISRGSCTTIPCHQQRAAVSPRLCKRTSFKPIPQESTLTIFLGGYEGVSQVYIANPAFSYAHPPPPLFLGACLRGRLAAAGQHASIVFSSICILLCRAYQGSSALPTFPPGHSTFQEVWLKE